MGISEMMSGDIKQNMIKVERFSDYGFHPQRQTFHMRDIFLELNQEEWEKTMLRNAYDIAHYHDRVEKHNRLKDFYLENFKDFENGVWVFIDGYWNRQSINHLSKRVKHWTAYLPADIDVYDVNWESKIKLSDDLSKCFGVYVPARCLDKIENIECTGYKPSIRLN